MEWRKIAGYEGYYEVSDAGLVRSLDRYVTDSTGKTRLLTGKNMKQSCSINKHRNTEGYLVVNLHKNCVSAIAQVHRLVAETFIPNPDLYPTVNHIDGDKHNNNVENLEWVSYAKNNIHALKTKLRHPRGTPIKQIDEYGNVVHEYVSVCEASRQTGIGRSMISHCVNGREKSAGGFYWKRIEKCNDYLEKESTPDDELLVEVQELRTAEDIVCSGRNI